MKKLILQGLAVLGMNVVVESFATLALLLFVFKGDAVLAAVPALFALPGIVLQPWFLLFFFLPGGPLLAPILTTVVTVAVYRVLNRKGKLERAKLVLAGKSRRIVTVFVAITLFGLAIAFARYVDFPALRHGVPRTLASSMKELDLALAKPRYYCLGSFVDSEWLWQTTVSESDLAQLAEKLDMHPMDARQIGDAFCSMPPYWWRPVMSDETRVFATANFPMEGRGPDGWHAVATWNPNDQVLHMWIKDNF